MNLHTLISEHRCWWRWAGLFTIVSAALLPALSLFAGINADRGIELSIDSFYPLLLHSIGLNLAGSTIALFAGLAAGLFHSLYRYRGEYLLRMLFLLPLATPPLLWAQGLKFLDLWLCRGVSGAIYMTAIVSLPLVMIATVSSCSLLTACQCDAARLSSGEAGLLRNAARFCFPSALMASLLGACIMLASPGAAMALGVKTAASEILVSFSALYDTKLAAIQCLVLAAAVMVTVLVSLVLAGKRPLEVLSLPGGAVQPRYHHIMSKVGPAADAFLLAFMLGLPGYGLMVHAFSMPDLAIVSETLSRTAGNTLFYSAASATIATFLGILMAFFMGRSEKHRVAGTCIMLLIFSIPAALPALGLVTAGTTAPHCLDLLFRGRAAVSLSQAVRLFPVSAILISRAFSAIPSSWTWAAEMHGISVWTYLAKIILPRLAKPMFSGFLITLLLSQADVATVLLLHPPGSQNLPLAIFTIMANAPRAVVSQLALIYIAAASVLLYVISRAGEPLLSDTRQQK